MTADRPDEPTPAGDDDGTWDGSSGPASAHVTPSSATYLRIYLDDHRAASAGGLALARRCQRNNAGSALGEELTKIVHDLRADETSLTSIVGHLGVSANPVKVLVARAGELLGRAKLNGQVRGYSPLSRLLELKLLLAGIDAKRQLWRSLIAAQVPVPESVDLEELERRATDQRQRLEPHHQAAGRVALQGEP